MLESSTGGGPYDQALEVVRGTGAKNRTVRVTRGVCRLASLFVRPLSLRLLLAAVPDLPRLGHETQPRAGFKDAVEEGRVAVRDRRGCGARESSEAREVGVAHRMSGAEAEQKGSKRNDRVDTVASGGIWGSNGRRVVNRYMRNGRIGWARGDK